MKLFQCQATLSVLYAIPITFVSFDEELARETLEIAYANKITYYDASFIALAEQLGANLVTDNPKHQRVSKAVKIKIIALKDY